MIYVLSGSRRETARWAKAQGLSLRTARHVYGAETLPGRIGNNEIAELPGFATRRDRFAILARLRRGNLNKVPIQRWKQRDDEVGDWYLDLGEPVPEDAVDPTEEAGPVITITPTTGETPQSHIDLVERVLPSQPSDETVDELDESDVDPLEEFLGLGEPIAAEKPQSVVDREEDPEVQPAPEPEPFVEPEQPKKRKGRRTNEQKFYDEALDAWENNGGSLEDVIARRDALAKRHPDDERLLTAPQSDEEVEAQADADDALDF